MPRLAADFALALAVIGRLGHAMAHLRLDDITARRLGGGGGVLFKSRVFGLQLGNAALQLIDTIEQLAHQSDQLGFAQLFKLLVRHPSLYRTHHPGGIENCEWLPSWYQDELGSLNK